MVVVSVNEEFLHFVRLLACKIEINGYIKGSTCGKIKAICNKHGALIIEDAAESLGAKYKLNGQWVETGTLGDYNCISFNGNNIFEKAA